MIALFRILDTIIMIYIWLIIIRAIVSWFNPNYGNPLIQLLIRLTEPVLGPVRRLVQRYITIKTFDISPIVVILLLEVLRNLLIRILVY